MTPALAGRVGVSSAGNANVVKRLKSVADEDVGISIITRVEVLRGRIDYLIKAEAGES